MMMRICSAKITPVLWFSLGAIGLLAWSAATPLASQTKSAKKAVARRKSPPPAAPAGSATLASLVRAWRQAPTPARRAAVVTYAAAHPQEAPLAHLALGVVSYEQKDFPGAIASLQKLNSKLPQLADYTAFYLAASRVESADLPSVRRDLLPTRSMELPSPLAARSWIFEARSLQTTQPADAVRILRDHYAVLPQPDGDVTLADCYQAAGDLPSAAEAYQRVYFRYPSGDAAARALAALLTLKDTMADKYPQPTGAQRLGRADRLLELHDSVHARAEYQSLVDGPPSAERDVARVRIGAADYAAGKIPAALPYLASLDLPESEADAERLYYLVECYRRQNDDEAMAASLKRLADKYQSSPWRLKALITAANRFLLTNRPADFVPLYKLAYQDFPNAPSAGTSHWKVAFQSWLNRKSDAGELLREHITRFPNHATTGAALYFLGRDAEERREPAEARAYYERLSVTFENHYYAMRARDRLQSADLPAAAPSPKVVAFLAELAFPLPKPVTLAPTHPTTWRIDRSRQLRAAGLSDLADSELRFGARSDGQPALLGMEMATSADTIHQGMRVMKNMSPEYLMLPIETAPRQYWELLFPLPYRDELKADAAAHGVDPYLLAGLIRQESEFDPNALSPAKAYGLTQVRPVTGRQFARTAGIARFTTAMLYQPAVNLKLGAAILRSMLDKNDGHLEQTLASYNAGPARLAEWLTWNTYREPAEFVESIPFTETRDYVQAVLRNADIYRRLYR